MPSLDRWEIHGFKRRAVHLQWLKTEINISSVPMSWGSMGRVRKLGEQSKPEEHSHSLRINFRGPIKSDRVFGANMTPFLRLRTLPARACRKSNVLRQTSRHRYMPGERIIGLGKHYRKSPRNWRFRPCGDPLISLKTQHK